MQHFLSVGHVTNLEIQLGHTKNIVFHLRNEPKNSCDVKYYLCKILAGLLKFNLLAQFVNISFDRGCNNPFLTFPNDTSKLAGLFSTLSINC